MLKPEVVGREGFRVFGYGVILHQKNGMKEGCEFGKLWAIDREQGS